MLTVFLDCLFLIATSVFFSVYNIYFIPTNWWLIDEED